MTYRDLATRSLHQLLQFGVPAAGAVTMLKLLSLQRALKQIAMSGAPIDLDIDIPSPAVIRALADQEIREELENRKREDGELEKSSAVPEPLEKALLVSVPILGMLGGGLAASRLMDRLRLAILRTKKRRLKEELRKELQDYFVTVSLLPSEEQPFKPYIAPSVRKLLPTPIEKTASTKQGNLASWYALYAGPAALLSFLWAYNMLRQSDPAYQTYAKALDAIQRNKDRVKFVQLSVTEKELEELKKRLRERRRKSQTRQEREK